MRAGALRAAGVYFAGDTICGEEYIGEYGGDFYREQAGRIHTFEGVLVVGKRQG